MTVYDAFNTHSDIDLLKLACKYRFQMAAANEPDKYLNMLGTLPKTSEHVVTAKDGDLRINFFSKAARFYMQSEVSVADALVVEGFRRARFDVRFCKHMDVFESLQLETEKFVNSVIEEQGPVFVTGWKPPKPAIHKAPDPGQP